MPVDVALLPVDVRAYRLARVFGWTLDQIDAAPAARCDWLLAMAKVEDEVMAEARRREREAMSR